MRVWRPGECSGRGRGRGWDQRGRATGSEQVIVSEPDRTPAEPRQATGLAGDSRQSLWQVAWAAQART